MLGKINLLTGQTLKGSSDAFQRERERERERENSKWKKTFGAALTEFSIVNNCSCKLNGRQKTEINIKRKV